MKSAQQVPQHRCVVLDGGLATELERRGADLSDALWSARLLLDQPELIRDVHQAYYDAGADVAITASYQASVDGFGARGLGECDARRAMARSVELAREAGERFWAGSGRAEHRIRPLVAASVGPYGAALADGSEYRGGYGVTRQQLADFHGPRLEALVGVGPDFLAIETMPSPDEAAVVLELLETWPEVQAWVSFTCRDEARVAEGQLLPAAINAVVEHPQVMAIGFNCIAPRMAGALLKTAGRVTRKPLVIYPNSGERWDAQARRWVDGEGEFDFAAAAPQWHKLGARLIGGCCRTTPETISAIRRALSSTTH